MPNEAPPRWEARTGFSDPHDRPPDQTALLVNGDSSTLYESPQNRGEGTQK